jgi:NDP-sugar pyrophosphorylase family protein
MNIVVPMSGLGLRFSTGGATLPKPLIDVAGTPMICRSVESLGIDGKYIFIVRKEHLENYDLEIVLRSMHADCEIVAVSSTTDGPACSVLLAREFVDNGDELIVVNCDQIFNWDPSDFMSHVQGSNADAAVVTYTSSDPKNSFALVDSSGCVSLIREKENISTTALVGLHYWKKGSDFVLSANEMICMGERTNNEFYVAPSYNYLIALNRKVIVHHVESDKEVFLIGTPADLQRYLDAQ